MLNRIEVIGRLGHDPEMSVTPAGKSVVKLSIGVSGKDTTQWFKAVAWERTAEIINEYTHKGSKVYLAGRMTSRKYTNKEGVEVTAWEITAEQVVLLDSKQASDA